MSAQNIFSENESNADNDLTRNPPVEKIMGLLGNEFINLKKVIDNRIEIKKWYQLVSKLVSGLVSEFRPVLSGLFYSCENCG